MTFLNHVFYGVFATNTQFFYYFALFIDNAYSDVNSLKIYDFFPKILLTTKQVY